MARKIDDETLVAYVDDELDEPAVRQVEEALFENSDARTRLRILRLTRDRLRADDGNPEYGTVPRGLVEAALTEPYGARPWHAFNTPLAASLAASLVVLAIGLGGGFLAGSYHARQQVVASAKEFRPDEDHWLYEMAEYYGIYANDDLRAVEIGPEGKEFLERWLGKRLNHQLRIPNLDSRGAAFRGGRLMVTEGQPTALLVYALPGGELVGLSITASWTDGDRAPRPHIKAGMNIVFWVDSGRAYTMMGTADHRLLRELATVAVEHFKAVGNPNKIEM